MNEDHPLPKDDPLYDIHTEKELPADDLALIIGRTILRYITPLVISVSGHIQEEMKLNGKLILSYTGSLTEYAKELIAKKKQSTGDLKK